MTAPTQKQVQACAQTCAAANVRKASRAITQIYGGFLAPVELEPTQYSLLVACMVAKDVTVSKLAEALAMDRSALARNLAVLEKQGLLTVSPGDDRRTRLVALTQNGKSTLAKAIPYWQEAQDNVERKFGTKRLRRLLGELQALMAAVRGP
jgi:DNA-binding MarR family transcriptional regulator